MKPCLQFSPFRAICIAGQWFAPFSKTLGEDSGEASGGTVRINSVFLPCSEGEASVALGGRPGVVFDGPVWISDALTCGPSGLVASGGWLTKVEQHAIFRERECTVEIRYDRDTGAEIGRTTSWEDLEGREVEVRFDALGIKGGSAARPRVAIIGTRTPDVANDIQACRAANLLSSEQGDILDGSDEHFGFRFPAWALSNSISHSFGYGPFRTPYHRALVASGFPISGAGGGSSTSSDHAIHKYRYAYIVEASFNYFTNLVNAGTTRSFFPRFDN